MYIHFQRNLVSRLVKTVYTNLFAKHRELHKFACSILPNSNLENSIISDMYHCMTYKYINFQQNRVSRSAKIVHTNVFAKNHKLH